EAVHVPGAAAERRLHAHGVRRACAGALLQQEPRRGHRDYAPRAPQGRGGLRRIYVRGGRDQGRADHRVCASPPASAPVYDGERITGGTSREDRRGVERTSTQCCRRRWNRRCTARSLMPTSVGTTTRHSNTSCWHSPTTRTRSPSCAPATSTSR